MTKLICFIDIRRAEGASSRAVVRRGVVGSTFSQWGVGVQRARSDVAPRIWRVICQISARKTSNNIFNNNNNLSPKFFNLFDANTWDFRVLFLT